jgi:hypothetical protein
MEGIIIIIVIVGGAALLYFYFHPTGGWEEQWGAPQTSQQEKDKFADQSQDIIQSQVVIRTYTGSQEVATALFRADSIKLAAENYFPTSQSWAPGQWGCSVARCFSPLGPLGIIFLLFLRS